MSWLEQRETIQLEARLTDPSIIILPKSHWFWQAISWILTIVTLTIIKRDVFLKEYATTAGPIWGMPDGWTAKTIRDLIPHEGRHTKQARVCGWFVPVLGWIPFLAPWVGTIVQLILYAFLPLPIGFAWFRSFMELDADTNAWRVKLRQFILTPDQVRTEAIRRGFEISGKNYFFSWPTKWAVRSYMNRAEEVITKFQSKGD